MKKKKHLIVITLALIGVFLLSTGSAVASGPVTRFSGIVYPYPEIPGEPPPEPPPPTELPGGRQEVIGWVLPAQRYEAFEPRIDGYWTITINGIIEASGVWTMWGSVEFALDAYPGSPEGGWEGEYHGTMMFKEDGIHATVVAEYQGTGALEGQRMKLVQKNRGASVTFSGSIFEHPSH